YISPPARYKNEGMSANHIPHLHFNPGHLNPNPRPRAAKTRAREIHSENKSMLGTVSWVTKATSFKNLCRYTESSNPIPPDAIAMTYAYQRTFFCVFGLLAP